MTRCSATSQNRRFSCVTLWLYRVNGNLVRSRCYPCDELTRIVTVKNRSFWGTGDQLLNFVFYPSWSVLKKYLKIPSRWAEFPLNVLDVTNIANRKRQLYCVQILYSVLTSHFCCYILLLYLACFVANSFECIHSRWAICSGIIVNFNVFSGIASKWLIDTKPVQTCLRPIFRSKHVYISLLF